jgi:hypothetical protein
MSVSIKGMNEMSVRLDDETDLGEDQKKIFRPWAAQNQKKNVLTKTTFFSFSYCPSQLRGWMDDGTDLGEAFFLLAIVRPD